MEFAQKLDAAAAATTCQMLDQMGGALVGYGAVSIAAGGAGLVPLSLGAAALLASNFGCSWDPDKPGPQDQGPLANLCWQTSGLMCLNRYYEGALSSQSPCDIKTWLGTTSTQDVGGGTIVYFAEYLDGSGVTRQTNYQVDSKNTVDFWTNGLPCEVPGPGNNPVQPYTWTDPDDGCQLTVSFQGMALDPSGTAAPVYKIEPAPQSRAGGIISGCNFEPVVYYGGPPGEPPRYGPWDPTWPDWDGSGDPPWKDFLDGLLGGAATAAISKLLDELFNSPLPASSKSIYAACQFKQDGTPEEFTINFPEQKYQDRVLDAMTAQVDFAQQFFLWKTPTCSGGGSSVTGEPVTITWRSDETSPVSAARVRKIFTYFDQSGSPQLDHVLHWENFTFQAGAVIVSVNGVPLGKPQVWAASADEGKRVINHAAVIAGVDMSKAEWVITSPRSTRYGVPGTMRVYKDEHNKIWVTKRDGPSGPVGLYG